MRCPSLQKSPRSLRSGSVGIQCSQILFLRAFPSSRNIPIEELNQEHRRINQEENHQLDNAQAQQFMGNLNLHENRQAGAMRAQGQAVGEKWTQSRKDFLKRSLNVKTVKHFPEKSVLTGDYGSKFKSRIKSDIKRAEKQRDKSSRLYKKKENSRLINACEKNVREEAFGKLSEHINMDQKLCDQEDLCDLAAFMDMEKNKAKELIDLFLNENEHTLGTNKQAALDQMLQGILSFNAENIRLDNDTELAKNGAKLESLTWKIAAFDRLSEKYKYFDQLDDDTKKQINDKLDRIRSVSDYYIIRKEIITDPMYKSHYNDELSMDFTKAETPEQTELAKKLLRAHIAGKNMMRKNGASAKLINSKGEPKFQNQQMAKQYIASQEYVYQSNLEIQSIRNHYITNAPMDKADRIVRLMEERKEAQRLSEQNSIVSVKSDAEQEEMENSGNLISGISERQWKQSGGTTYKKVMAKEDADRIVKKSKGFLTAVKTEDGLMEIKQSLPEEVVIKGQKVHLRKAWNLLIKAGVTMVTNEDGSFKTDQESSRRGLLFSNLLSIYRSMDDPREQFEDTLKQEFAPVMEQLLRENYEAKGVVSAKALEEAKKEVKNLCNELLLVLDANHEMSGGLPLLPREAMLGDYVDNMKTFGQVDDEMMENFLKGYKFRENQVVKKIVNGVEVSENVIVEREATDEEIKAAVASIRKDIQISNGQLKKVRDIDIDSKVVPIPNTCSANMLFYRNLQKICTGYSDFIEYRPKEYIRKHPLQVLNFLKKNIYLLADADGSDAQQDFEKAVKTLNGMTLRESREGLSPEELKAEEKKINKLASIADRFGKYEFHAAAHIFSDEDDGDMTIEGFAAETSQFMVEPFSLNAGIGQYKGKLTDEPDNMTKNTKKQEGYSKYYSNDNLYNADKVQILKIYLNRVMKEKPDSFPSVMAKKIEDEAKIKRQQE